MSVETGVGIIMATKGYITATLMGIFGGIAHAIQEVKKQGWKGWISFASDVIVCVFFGQIFYQIGLLFYPKEAIILTSLGSFWGAKSFDYLRVWILNSIKSNVK